MKKLLSLLLACMVLFAFAGCEKTEPTEAQQTSGSSETQKTEIDYENLPAMDELRGMDQETKEDVCTYVLKMDYDTAAKQIEKVYREAVDKIDGLEFKSVEIVQDNLYMTNGERPLGNLFVTLNCTAPFDADQDQTEVDSQGQEWVSALLDAENQDAVTSIRMRNITYNFENEEGTRSFNHSVEITVSGNSIFGIKAYVPENEQAAIDVTMEFIRGIDKQGTIKKFGKNDDGVFYIQILSGNSYDDAQPLAEKLLSDLKADESAWSYIEEQDCSSMEIDFFGRDTVTLEIS